MNKLKVFVYGTLKPGERNYQKYCAGKVVEAKRAIAFGQLFALPMGYPAMTPGDTPVSGFLLSFANPDILHILDELEDYDPNRAQAQNGYNRVQIDTYKPGGEPLATAWVYLMTPERVSLHRGVLLPLGWWSSSGRSPSA
ncbi:gamma-glutamylcyclotransferase [Microcoleus sp. FACHB-831]|uniref:gamma-glutamylcyclotransferase family protein n=1 Tax=Microcoleus sp. FACHB-831 TaxID=2692827 RepID=UPI0018F01946|nr:gamma-glutamylcyclotransferase [Microcoleus sp. FACHB-831]